MHLLVVSQVYVPDPAAVGQHLASAAEALTARGHRVTVLTANRGYDDPAVRYAAREIRAGVQVVRLPFSSLGKRSLAVRLVGMLLFLSQAAVRSLVLPGVEAVLVSTSPPMAGVVMAVVAWLRRVPLIFWAMDLNPEQAVALGKARAGSLGVRLFGLANRFLQGAASGVIVLDRFMARSLEARGSYRPKTLVLPPWPLESERLASADGRAFRREHGLEGKFVIMHSGNHSLAHPLSTLLDAARALARHSDAAMRMTDDEFRVKIARLSLAKGELESANDDSELRAAGKKNEGEIQRAGGLREVVFVFVGGGVGKREVEEVVAEGLPNVISLPYQPLEKLADTLAAADVQVVAMGDAMVGCVHPCKVYGALAAGKPVLYLGPVESHVGEIVAAGAGWRVAHGDVAGMVARVRELAVMEPEKLVAIGAANRRMAEVRFNAERMRAEFCAFVEEIARN